MNLYLSLLFLLLIAFNVNSQKDKLQGLWNSSWEELIPTNLATDDPFYHIYHNTDFYFEGDSLWKLEFPCKRLSVDSYSIEEYVLINDSTLVYAREKFYRQQNYDTSAILALKKHELNSECYSGKWVLIRTESGGDGTGVEFIFPFKVKDEIDLSEGTLDGNTITLKMDGEEREFNFYLERIQFEYQLVLTPTESWKKQDKVMWERFWELPKPSKKELKKIKQDQGIELRLRFMRI